MDEDLKFGVLMLAISLIFAYLTVWTLIDSFLFPLFLTSVSFYVLFLLTATMTFADKYIKPKERIKNDRL